jgi:N-acetylneuraminic acid mutarotase
MLKYLLWVALLLAILLTACDAAEPAVTPAPVAEAPTVTRQPPSPTPTSLPPTATPSLEPTVIPTTVPTETPTDTPDPTDTPELIVEASPDLAAEHDSEVVAEVVEPEFAGEAIQATWQELKPANAGPGPRYEHAMQYSPATNQLFVFGGRDGSQVFNDIWALNLDNLTWRPLAVNSPTAPPARFSTVMMVDATGENLYLATGQRQDNSVMNDVWRLDLTSETWQELTVTADPAPTARYGAAGGNLNDKLVVTHGFGSTRYDDTWLFDPTSGQWQNITPSGELPLKRCLLAAAPLAGQLVLHGGCSSGFGPCPQDDTWVLDTAGQNWRQVTGNVKPVGRQHQTLTRVGEQNRVLLFGGQDGNRAARSDLWLLDLATESWQPIEAGTGPAARYNHQAVWTAQGLIVFGGRDSAPLADLWLLTF